MARDPRIEHSNNGELTRSPAGNRANSGMPLLTGIVPPLASSIWQRFNRLKDESHRITGWITEHASLSLSLSRLTSSPLIQPALKLVSGKGVAISNVWRQALDLSLFRQQMGQPNESLGQPDISGIKRPFRPVYKPDASYATQPPITSASEPYTSDIAPTQNITSDKQTLIPPIEHQPGDSVRKVIIPRKQIITAKEQILPTQRLTHTAGATELPRPVPGIFRSTRAAPVTLPTDQAVYEIEAEDTARLEHEATKIQQTGQSPKPGHQYDSKAGKTPPASASRESQPAQQNRLRDKVWLPIKTKLGLQRVPAQGQLSAAQEDIHPKLAPQQQQHEPDVTDKRTVTELEARPSLPTTPYPSTAIARTETVPEPSASMDYASEGMAMSLPKPVETALPKSLKIPAQPVIAGTTGTFDRLWTRLPKTVKDAVSGLTGIKPGREPALYKSPSRPMVLPAKISPSIPSAKPPITPAIQRTEVAHTEHQASATHAEVSEPSGTPADFKLPPGWQTDRVNIPPVSRDFPPVSDAHHQMLPERDIYPEDSSLQPSDTPGNLDRRGGIYRTPALPHSEPKAPPTVNRSEPVNLKQSPDHHTPEKHEESQPLPLDAFLSRIIDQDSSSNTETIDESLVAKAESPSYYGRQPAPELALAPVGHAAETTSQTASRAEPSSADTGERTTAPDIDAIARDVYHILKRRLARERERALGLS